MQSPLLRACGSCVGETRPAMRRCALVKCPGLSRYRRKGFETRVPEEVAAALIGDMLLDGGEP